MFPLPTVEAVAGHLSQFTRGPAGRQLNTFTDDSHPTRAEVDAAITTTAVEVSADAGDLDESLYSLAADVTALGAASAVIIDRSADFSEILYTRFKSRLATLRRAAGRRGTGRVGSIGVPTPLSRRPQA